MVFAHCKKLNNVGGYKKESSLYTPFRLVMLNSLKIIFVANIFLSFAFLKITEILDSDLL